MTNSIKVILAISVIGVILSLAMFMRSPKIDDPLAPLKRFEISRTRSVIGSRLEKYTLRYSVPLDTAVKLLSQNLDRTWTRSDVGNKVLFKNPSGETIDIESSMASWTLYYYHPMPLILGIG